MKTMSIRDRIRSRILFTKVIKVRWNVEDALVGFRRIAAEAGIRLLNGHDGTAMGMDNTYGKLLRILCRHVGERGADEGAVECLKRLIRERHERYADAYDARQRVKELEQLVIALRAEVRNAKDRACTQCTPG